MLRAIIGDIAGSRFEWLNHKNKDFDLLMRDCHITDDSVMSLAVCDALLRSKPDYHCARSTVPWEGRGKNQTAADRNGDRKAFTDSLPLF